MPLTLSNPIVAPVGTTTASFSRAIKVTGLKLMAGSATACSVSVADLNGNLLAPVMSVNATAGAIDQFIPHTPLVWPGGTATSVTNWVVTVTGSGALFYITHR